MTTPSVDVSKLSLGDIASNASRLSLGSALWIGGLIVALATGSFALGQRRSDAGLGDSLRTTTHHLDSLQRRLTTADSMAEVTEKFGDLFAKSLSDERVLSAIADGFRKERPAGISDQLELRRLIGWQLLAQQGRASFYRGDSVFRVRLAKNGDHIDVKWETHESVIIDALRRLEIAPSSALLARINGELNRGVAARLDNHHMAVRQPEDALSVVSSDQ
jgi:hypothetical protein